MRVLTTLCSAALAASLVGAGPAQSQIAGRTFRFSIQNTMDHPLGIGAQRFSELVSQKSGGKMKVTVYAGGSLGGDVQTMSALQGGTIDFMTVTAGLLVGIIKPFGMYDLPYLFNSVEEADAIVDGPLGRKLQGLLPEKGLVGLGYWDLGFRNVTNSKRPISKLEDLQGLKLRTLQSPIFIDMFSALGANPFPSGVHGTLHGARAESRRWPGKPGLGDRVRQVQRSAEAPLAHAPHIRCAIVHGQQEDLG